MVYSGGKRRVKPAAAAGVLLLAAVSWAFGAQDPDGAGAGAVRFGCGGCVEYLPGTMPLIITIPHGGTREPVGMPDRISATLARYDTNSLELGRALSEAIRRRTGNSPHVIITHVHRKKLDTNRDVFEAAQEDTAAIRIWEEYHGFIEEAKRDVERRFGGGLLIDLHGHRHRKARVELGYLLMQRELNMPEDSLNIPLYLQTTSVRALAERAGKGLAEIIRGRRSLGTLLAERGYPAVPGQRHPGPGPDPYFSGGYTTEQHGSAMGGTISAIQMETPWHGVRDTGAHRKAFARAAAEALDEFLKTWFPEGRSTP
jgi:N-formylglutamate amidohydrolase